jgi:hypothetical protein
MNLCPWCRKGYEPSGDGRCPYCGTVPPEGETLAAAPPDEPAATGAPRGFGARTLLDLLLGPEGTGLPWENRARWGAARGLALTLRALLFSPLRAFRVMRRDGGWGEPLVYALVVGGAACAMIGLRQALAGGQAFLLLERLASPALEAGPGGRGAVLGLPERLVLGLAWAPPTALLLPAAATLAAHPALKLSGCARPLGLTYRVVCYALASAAVLAVVPFCGLLLALGWYLALTTTGFLIAHRARFSQAVGAALVPPVAAGILLAGCGLILDRVLAP